mmetsp:Transcript_23653/g.69934  ORF Transcript_23653/g.69934 Transcript_23653/m.69934 type:complete len:230 (+) Transcript_23653:514-1203(+)
MSRRCSVPIPSGSRDDTFASSSSKCSVWLRADSCWKPNARLRSAKMPPPKEACTIHSSRGSLSGAARLKRLYTCLSLGSSPPSPIVTLSVAASGTGGGSLVTTPTSVERGEGSDETFAESVSGLPTAERVRYRTRSSIMSRVCCILCDCASGGADSSTRERRSPPRWYDSIASSGELVSSRRPVLMSSIALAYDVPESWAVAVDVRPELPLGSTREKVPNSSAIAARLV